MRLAIDHIDMRSGCFGLELPEQETLKRHRRYGRLLVFRARSVV
ncbi:hypothetical protein [Bradyrhizobium sp. SRS-191]|nr:hypothetical protein [Bradyrhizobium sp. SRS-191]